MKFLSIIIPRYKEPEQKVFHLLSSINNQLGVDFEDIEILICNDGGSSPLDDNFIKLFNQLDIHQIQLHENGGPGLARQAGIDQAKGQYLMFCDADDILHNVGVLDAMMTEAKTSAPDILYTNWLEELVENGERRYLPHNHENTWMHGKLIRKAYIDTNNIRHHSKLRVHEDSYFLALAAAFTDRLVHLDITSYVWKYYPESITRVNDAVYTYESIPTFIYANFEAFKVIEQRRPELMEYKVIQLLIYHYFSLNQPHWKKHPKYIKRAENKLSECMRGYWHYLDDAKPETIAQIYNEERARNNVSYIEDKTVADWIRGIRSDSEHNSSTCSGSISGNIRNSGCECGKDREQFKAG